MCRSYRKGDFLLLDGGHLDAWRAATVGYIFLVRTLHFMPRLELFLSKARQLLASGSGLVVVTVPLFSLEYPEEMECIGPSGDF